MSWNFFKTPNVQADVSGLIELSQTLVAARETLDWDAVMCVAQCLDDMITGCDETPKGLQFRPSPTSLIAMSCESGVLAREDGSDFKCAKGDCVSDCAAGFEPCNFFRSGACQPDHGKILLENGLTYRFNSSCEEQRDLLDELDAESEETTNAEAEEDEARVKENLRHAVNDYCDWAKSHKACDLGQDSMDCNLCQVLDLHKIANSRSDLKHKKGETT